jgi:hypothetical protein
MKTCSRCKKIKRSVEFQKNRARKDGFRSECKLCSKILVKRSRARNAYSQRTNILLRHAQNRAKKKELLFDLYEHKEKIKRRVQKGVCEISGIPLRFDGGRTYDSPSIDRINPKEGYQYSNIRIVSLVMNCALGNWGENVLKEVMEKWERKVEKIELMPYIFTKKPSKERHELNIMSIAYEPKIFSLIREHDESGISGTGLIAGGVKFPDGTCVLHWYTICTSTAVYKNIEELEKIHGHGGKTKVVFHDREFMRGCHDAFQDHKENNLQKEPLKKPNWVKKDAWLAYYAGYLACIRGLREFTPER